MSRLALAAGIAGFVTVAMGAFGAHGLKLTPEAQDWWDTATFYALSHVVAALAIAVSGRSQLARAGWAFLIGAVIFGGTLYAMALGAPHYLGAVTPLGGLAFLAGWGLIIRAATTKL